MGGSLRVRQFTMELCDALCRMAGAGRAAVVADGNRGLLRRAARTGVRTAEVRLTGSPRGDRRALDASVDRLDDFAPELIHAHGYDAAWAADRLSRRHGVPWMLSVLSEWPSGWRSRRLISRAAGITALSARSVPDALRDAVWVIPGGIDKREFTPAAVPENLMAELGLNLYTLHMGLVGWFHNERSGGLDFIRAAAHVASRIPLTEFIVVGDGRLTEAMSTLAHRLGALGNVRFLGARADRGRLYRVMDCVVLPAHSSVFAWELVEAAAAGCPAIASDTVAHREVAGDDPSVTYYAPGDWEGLARELLQVVGSGGDDMSSDAVDLAELGTGLHGVVRARISSTHYEVGDEELEEVEDPDAPDSLRRRIYRTFEIGRIAKRYTKLYRDVTGARG